MNDPLAKLLGHTADWPETARNELADIVREIEAEPHVGAYHATPDELAGIDRGLRDAEQSRFASNDSVHRILGKHEPK